MYLYFRHYFADRRGTDLEALLNKIDNFHHEFQVLFCNCFLPFDLKLNKMLINIDAISKSFFFYLVQGYFLGQ